MGPRRTHLRVLIVVAFVASLSLGALLVLPRSTLALVPHAPIFINGNANFTAANGVTGGNGTAGNPYIIEGWDINASTAHGIQVQNTWVYFVIRNVSIYSGNKTLHSGISLISVNYGVIRDSNLTDNYVGIDARFVNSMVIARNSIFKNHIGITFYSTWATTVSANIFTNDGMRITGFAPVYYNSHTITPDNSVNGKPLYYYKNCNGLIVDGVIVGQLLVASCTNVKLANLTVDKSSVGIGLGYVNGGVVTRNHLSGHTFSALDLEECSDVNITANNVSSNPGEGIRLDNSPRTRIQGNNISANFLSGIDVDISDSVTVSGNHIWNDFTEGIYILGGYAPTIKGNWIHNNFVGIADSSNSAGLFSDNNVSNNGYGFHVLGAFGGTIANNTVGWNAYTGIYLSSSQYLGIYHNNLLYNAQQAHDDMGPENSWNLSYPGGGNYWSNYTGVDLCSGPSQTTCTGPDGFGDSPFIIDGDSKDSYPLMRGWGLPNTPPKASFTVAPPNGDTLTSFLVDASSTTDAEDPPSSLDFRWDWESNGTWTSWMTSRMAQHIFPRPGTYTIHMQVVDPGGLMDNATRSVAVSLASLRVSVVVNRSSGHAPLAVTFTGSPGGGTPPYTYAWTFGDGGTSSVADPSHIFQQKGNYTVTLTVTDSAGASAMARSNITVLSSPSTPPALFPFGFSPWILGGVVVVAAGGLGIALLVRRRRHPPPPDKGSGEGPP